MAADGDADVAMEEQSKEAEPDAAPAETSEEAGADSPAAKAEEEEPAKAPEPTPEECVSTAESAKDAGNTLLKEGDFAGAAQKYREGLDLTEPLLEKDPAEIGEDLQKRGTAVYIALRLNSAQAFLKQSAWVDVIEHADKVLIVEKDNTKALYRRGLAGIKLDTEGRLEQARQDFARMAQLEPTNREAREQHQKAKDRLKDLKQQEKERLSLAMQGGLYQEQHKKLGKQQAAYEEEVKRRKEAEEDEISWEDWTKKEKEKQEELEKKQKEEARKRREDEQLEQEKRQLEEENQRRKSDGQEELSLEDWRAAQAKKVADDRKTEEVVKADDVDLDEEERKLLQETKNKGYYHGRLGTVLSDAAPKPQQVANAEVASNSAGSEWNQAGTWEEKDVSSWAKERLTALLQKAHASCPEVTLPSGSTVAVTAKVTKVKTITGEAHIVYVRKQPRHGFNYEAELSFDVSLGDAGKFGGYMNLPELMDATTSTQLRIDARWKSGGPSEEILPLATEWLDKLRDNVRSQVAAFREEYQAKA